MMIIAKVGFHQFYKYTLQSIFDILPMVYVARINDCGPPQALKRGRPLSHRPLRRA